MYLYEILTHIEDLNEIDDVINFLKQEIKESLNRTFNLSFVTKFLNNDVVKVRELLDILFKNFCEVDIEIGIILKYHHLILDFVDKYIDKVYISSSRDENYDYFEKNKDLSNRLLNIIKSASVSSYVTQHVFFIKNLGLNDIISLTHYRNDIVMKRIIKYKIRSIFQSETLPPDFLQILAKNLPRKYIPIYVKKFRNYIRFLLLNKHIKEFSNVLQDAILDCLNYRKFHIPFNFIYQISDETIYKMSIKNIINLLDKYVNERSGKFISLIFNPDVVNERLALLAISNTSLYQMYKDLLILLSRRYKKELTIYQKILKIIGYKRLFEYKYYKDEILILKICKLNISDKIKYQILKYIKEYDSNFINECESKFGHLHKVLDRILERKENEKVQ